VRKDQPVDNAARFASQRLNRRRLAQAAAALGGAGLASSLRLDAFAQDATPLASPVASPVSLNEPPLPDYTKSVSITSWGFGAEETNPMAFSRIDAFKKAYPSINLTLVPQFDDQKLLTAFASKQLPDVLWMDRGKLGSWAARGVLQPIDDLVAQAGIDTSKYYPAALEEAKFEGKLYGLPGFIDVRAMYVNLDALKEIGQDSAQFDTGNWDQLTELAAKLVKKNGNSITQWGLDNKLQAGWLYLWGAANGGSFLSEDGKTVSFNDPKIVEALEWGVNDYDAQGGFDAYSAVASTWQGDEQFARGQVALTLYENWMLGIIARVAPDLNFEVVPMKKRNDDGMVSFSGGPAWAIPNGAPNVEAAWQFIRFMDSLQTWRIGAQGVKQYQQKQGKPYIPSLTANRVADQMQIQEFYEPIGEHFDAAVKLWPQILDQSQNRPISRSAASAQIDDILLNDGVKPALSKSKPPKDALDDANKEAQDAIDSL
jgi:multiple sugar transport system substrate-binding protein